MRNSARISLFLLLNITGLLLAFVQKEVKELHTRIPKYCYKVFHKDDNHDEDELRTDLKCKNDIPSSYTEKQGEEVCKQLFSAQLGSISAEGKGIDELCLNPYYQEEANWCAHTCKLCCMRPEYACSDKNLIGANCADAIADPERCKEPDMAENCKQSCGRCNLDHTLCEDKHIGCKYMKGLCSNEKHKIKMERLCPKSCDEENNTSTACDKVRDLHKFRKEKIHRVEGCKDTGSGCAQNVMLCEDEYYIDQMAESCKATCGRCVKPDFVCKDKKDSPCDTWKANGFCDEDGTYPKGVILQHCPKACNYCT